MTALGDARTGLFDALTVVFVEPVAGFTYAQRVHRTRPATIAAPAVWIGASSGSRQTTRQGAELYVVTFPVSVVYDGADQAQVDGLEEVVTRVIAAASRAGTPVGHSDAELPSSRPGTVSTLRAAVVDVDVTVLATTLCQLPVLQETTS